MPSIDFEPLHADVEPPSRASVQSAGYDLRAYLAGRMVTCSDGQRVWEATPDGDGERSSLLLHPGMRALVPLGFKARLPEGYEAQVRPRSGLAFRKGLEIPNAPGTIDADFPDEWKVIVKNGAAHPISIVHGERIAQAVLARFETLAWTEGAVERSTERAGGFGSTGV
jgi:dUTP pyrophosphatase